MIQKILESTKSTKRIKREMGEGKLWMMRVKDKNGEITRTRAGIVEAATDFYDQLFDSNTNIKHRYLQKMEEEEEIPPILKGEVETAIKHLKNNRAPGEEGIINECLKWRQEELAEIMTDLFNKIMETEIIPEQWHTSTMIVLHKKGSHDDLNNYRPVSLLPTTCKVCMKILTRTLTTVMDENQLEEQAGFHAKYSTMDHLQATNQVIEKSHEFNQNLYIAYIDYNKAFNSVEQDRVL
jgi:hypothetical protein